MAADRVTDAMVEAALKAWQETNVTFGDLHSLMRAAIESALRAEAGAVGWLPIETAPNTDSPASIHVLVWLPEFGAHRGQYTKFYADTGEWPWSADLFSKLANKTITHWQPLPGSP